MSEEPSVLTRMRLSCWGDNLNEKELNEVVDYINYLQQENQELKKENKILRENAEHNDKVIDKVNWENQKLKKQLEEYKKIRF